MIRGESAGCSPGLALRLCGSICVFIILFGKKEKSFQGFGCNVMGEVNSTGNSKAVI